MLHVSDIEGLERVMTNSHQRTLPSYFGSQPRDCRLSVSLRASLHSLLQRALNDIHVEIGQGLDVAIRYNPRRRTTES